MTFLAPWLVAATCVTGSATFVPADQGSSSSSSSSKPPQGGSAQPHHLGLGATFSLGAKGGGATVRYFFNDRVGLDTRVLLASRPNGTGHTEGFTIQFAPSLMFMLTKPNTTSNIDVRPYAGVGFSYTHAQPDVQLGYPAASGVGAQVFGGVEIQFRQADSFAMSVEVAHFFQSEALQRSAAPHGTAALIAVHLYR